MDRALESLWANTSTSNEARFDPQGIGHLPSLAQRFVLHAIEAGAPLAQAVRLRMRGEIKLKQWAHFEAEQVIAFPQGMVWTARANMGFPIVGYDRLLGAVGEMNWKLFGLIPVMRAAGPGVSRSASGRLAGELCWLPSALLSDAIHWQEPSGNWQPLVVTTPVAPVKVQYRLGASGELFECQVQRWGNPGGGDYAEHPFGVVFTAERRFGGYTIGSEMVAGWNFPADPAGEFFRATIESAEYR